MAVLSSEERERVKRFLMRIKGPKPSVSKSELLAAIDAIDQWIEDNQTSFNTALPEPFKTQATLQQKTMYFCRVAMRRAGILSVMEDN